jgi:hypothetical protein
MFIDQATHSGIGENEKEKEREGEGESGSTVDRLVCLAADDSSVGDSASATSTKQLFATIFALMRGLRSHVPCFGAGRPGAPRGGQHTGSRRSYLLTGMQLEGTAGTRDSTVLDVLGRW